MFVRSPASRSLRVTASSALQAKPTKLAATREDRAPRPPTQTVRRTTYRTAYRMAHRMAHLTAHRTAYRTTTADDRWAPPARTTHRRSTFELKVAVLACKRSSLKMRSRKNQTKSQKDRTRDQTWNQTGDQTQGQTRDQTGDQTREQTGSPNPVDDPASVSSTSDIKTTMRSPMGEIRADRVTSTHKPNGRTKSETAKADHLMLQSSISAKTIPVSSL